MTIEPERVRRALAFAFMWAGWLGALTIFAYATATYDPNHGNFAPQWVGFSFIFCIGVAIAGSTARARMRLADSIVAAFRAGFEASDNRPKE